LKRVAEPVSQNNEELQTLSENMWETMYHASGVGLAAPQIGVSQRIFIVDTIQIMEEDNKEKGIKQVFINAVKIADVGDEFADEEGCVSIADVRADGNHQRRVKLRYLDENFEEHPGEFDGTNARVIQHEYDHLEGEL